MATTEIGRTGEMAHDHIHDYRSAGRRSLLLVLGLILCHITIEIVGAFLSGSLGLLAHATHMVTDAVAISLALFAMWIAQRPATITRTFGFHRIEVLVVLINAVALCVLATWIFYGAYQRFVDLSHDHAHELNGAIMLSVGLAGLFINVFAAWTLYRTSEHSINVEGAFWHIIADLAGSFVVVVSSVLILLFDWDLVDPILSVVMGLLIMAGSIRLAMKVSSILLENIPAGLDMYRLCSRMEDIEGVTLVHDVHAWTITTGYNALDAHVLVDRDFTGNVEQLMRRLSKLLVDEFGIHHVTLQMEHSATECSEQHHVGHLMARTLSEA